MKRKRIFGIILMSAAAGFLAGFLLSLCWKADYGMELENYITCLAGRGKGQMEGFPYRLAGALLRSLAPCILLIFLCRKRFALFFIFSIIGVICGARGFSCGALFTVCGTSGILLEIAGGLPQNLLILPAFYFLLYQCFCTAISENKRDIFKRRKGAMAFFTAAAGIGALLEAGLNTRLMFFVWEKVMLLCIPSGLFW